MSDNSKINEKILAKFSSYTKNKNELRICEELFLKELLWYDLVDPPFKRDFPLTLNRHFPFTENE